MSVRSPIDSGDDAEQIAIRVNQHHEVGVVWVVPRDPLSAKRNQPLHLRVLIRLVVGPQVEVHPVFLVEMETGAGCGIPRQEECRILRVWVEGERLGPERTSPVDVRHSQHNCSESQHGWHARTLRFGSATSSWSSDRSEPGFLDAQIAQVEVTVLPMTDVPNVLLRTPTDDDLDVLFSIAADLDTWEERNPLAPVPLTRGRFDARRALTAESAATDQSVSFVIDVDGTAVGDASLFEFDSFARHAEAGISLVPQARGRGIGTAAIAQLIDFGFVRHNLRRIHLQAIASNTGAIRAYEKAGFVVEGRQREHAWVRGAYEDIVLMGILRSDGPAR